MRTTKDPPRPSHSARDDDLRIVCAVSHLDETTLGLTLRSIERQTVRPSSRRVISGIVPMCASFNAALDYASDLHADLLFHTASDVIAETFALDHLLSAMDPNRHYLSVGRGYDILNGQGTSVGLWVFNMRILGRAYRFRDVFKQDLDLCERVEAETNAARTYIGYETSLGYHHPIWTPREMYMKLRYGVQKYDEQTVQHYRRFLESELGFNPNNKVLMAGLRGLDQALENPHDWGSKDPSAMEEELTSLTHDLDLRGTEYYVHHLRFKRLAQALNGSIENCLTLEERGGFGGSTPAPTTREAND